MLLFVLDAVIGTGWGQKGETAQSVGRVRSGVIGSDDKPQRVLASTSPRRGAALAERWILPPSGCSLRDYAAAFACSRQAKVVPSSHIRCMMTASLRATARRARLPPARLATLTAQAFNADHRVHRVSSALAAS